MTLMRDVLVSLDLETTGLDPSSDKIIEIGIVRFQGDQILERWNTLIYPGRNVPPHITRLTGIRSQDVEGSPRFGQVLPQIRRFIGAAPIVGHSVGFDLAFLRSEGFVPASPIIDTYTLASVLLPATPRYNLSALAIALEIVTGHAHRALDDAEMTQALYLELYRRALALPLNTLAEIVQAGEHIPWEGAYFFRSVLAERTRDAFKEGQRASSDTLEWDGSEGSGGPRLKRLPNPQPISADEAIAVIAPEGPLAGALDGYEFRPQQAAMMSAVVHALNNQEHTLIEAPTGVGKSIGYLVPAALFSVRNDERIVISTNTITLQEQLLLKDIPLLQRTLGIPLRAAVMKGRSNYLCPRRLSQLRHRGPTSEMEMHMLAKLLVWLSGSRSGDRADLTLRGPDELGVWYRLSAEDEGCSTTRCESQMGGQCPYYKARRDAESAHIVIVNHALLLSDMQTSGRVLPDYRYLIVDEAHHLEEAITSSLTFRIDSESLMRQIAEMGDASGGMLGDLLRVARSSVQDSYYRQLEEFVAMVSHVTSDMKQHVEWFFKSLRQFVENNVNLSRSDYVQQVRLVPALRRHPGWSEVEIRWDNLSKFTGEIASAMTKLSEGLGKLEEKGLDDADDLISATRSAARRLVEIHAQLSAMVIEPDANTIYWTEFQGGRRFSVHAAPLSVGAMVEEQLWSQNEAVILASATLRTDGTFDYLRSRLNAELATEVVIDSPFDYESSTLLYLINDIPEPNEQVAYQRAVEQGLLALCSATQGRAMVLFTSYAQLRETANAIGDQLAEQGIALYDQSDGVSRMHLLEGFVQSERAVLMGTRSFWEGVDVPGDDLSVLAIVRLPFSVPSDPLYAARSELFDNPFAQYAVPEAILRFRQGFGRLIRRKSDRGVVAIFDKRVISKPYGRQFLSALPQCTVRQGRLNQLPDAAVEWLNLPF